MTATLSTGTNLPSCQRRREERVTGPVTDWSWGGRGRSCPKVQCAPAGELYTNTKLRMFSEVDENTRKRAALLAKRAGLLEAAKVLRNRYSEPAVDAVEPCGVQRGRVYHPHL